MALSIYLLLLYYNYSSLYFFGLPLPPPFVIGASWQDAPFFILLSADISLMV